MPEPFLVRPSPIGTGDITRYLIGCFVLAATLLAPLPSHAQDGDQRDALIPMPSGEKRLVQEVRHQLLLLPYFTIFDDLAFRINGDTVTLMGDVTNPTLKSDAGNVVKRIEGVTQVTNNINVLPLSSLDNQIRRAEFRAIYGEPTIGDRYGNRALPSIHIIVNNGHVRLEGIVANQGDRNLINIRANGVPNVFSVQNNLKVETT